MDGQGAILILLVAVPVVAAVGAFLTRGRMQLVVVLAAVSLLLFLSAALARTVSLRGTLSSALGGFASPLGIELLADGLTVFMVLLTACVAALVSVYAIGYLPLHARPERDLAGFWPLWFAAWAGMNALYLSSDLFNLYVALEVIGLASVGLIALGSAAALGAALRYVLVSMLGSLAYLAGVGLLYGAHGAVDLTLVASLAGDSSSDILALALMGIGLALKTALFPLHFWLPSAHANALGPVSAMLSALVVKSTFYLLVRLYLAGLGATLSDGVLELMGVLGVLAILWGSLQAISTRSLKRLIAYSTVAQIGYLFIAFPLARTEAVAELAFTGALYFVASHACAKAAMFLAASSLKDVVASGELSALRGVGRRAPVTTFALGLSGITLIGLPPTGGFIAKWLLLGAALQASRVVLAAVMLLGSLLAAVYVFRPLSLALLAPPSEPKVRAPRSRLAESATFALALLGLVLGLAAREPLEFLSARAPLGATHAAGRAR